MHYLFEFIENHIWEINAEKTLGKKNKENRTTKDQEEQQDGEQDGWDGRGQPGK